MRLVSFGHGILFLTGVLTLVGARIAISVEELVKRVVADCESITSTLPTLMFNDNLTSLDNKPISLTLAALHFNGIDVSEKSMTLLAQLIISWEHPCDFQSWLNDSILSDFIP